jgi:hypothetical protein
MVYKLYLIRFLNNSIYYTLKYIDLRGSNLWV